MDNELFKQRLSEVAEWAIPKLTKTDINEAKSRARGRRSAEQRYQEEHEQVFAEIFEGINPTHPPEVLKVKNQATVCDDCGCHCAEGRKKEKKLYDTGGKKNWRERCLTCNRNKNPFTGEYDLTPQQASHVWTEFLRVTKGTYKTQGNAARNHLNKEEADK